MILRITFHAAQCVMLCLSVSIAAAQSPPAAAENPARPVPQAEKVDLLDADLLGDVQDVLDEAMQAEAAPAGETQPKPPSAQGDAMLRALQTVGLEMQNAARGLSSGDAGTETQAAQQRAMQLMQAIVDQSAENQNQSSSEPSPSSAQEETSQPGQEESPTDPSGEEDSPRPSELGTEPGTEAGSSQDVVVKAGQVQSMRESVWGHLPEQTRGELRASLPETFLPQYRDAIAEYFQRLSTPSGEER